ncbi:MAG: pyrophosphate--fructose-6-phosphate 1-phosphotransferase [Candidatus Neomarinimicrobiota bacterium]
MKIAFLTAGGLAPCLSASIGALINRYAQLAPRAQLFGYEFGYKGLLLGKLREFPHHLGDRADLLYSFGGSPLGNSRVKLTNAEDCIKNGYIQKGQDPLEKAADQLMRDGINILHTIGGDDTNTMAGVLASRLKRNGYDLTVVGLPKTVDNDIYPIAQSLGAYTAAEQGALFFDNIANENTTSTRHLIIHEVMGRNCGWLAAYTAKIYHENLARRTWFDEIGLTQNRWDVDAVYIPEMEFDPDQEMQRLKLLMDSKDCVNIFLSEGAATARIVKEIKAEGRKILKDAFGHIPLDKINAGKWLSKIFSKGLKADKVLVQKSGYFARSAAPNAQDLELIKKSAYLAAEMALKQKSGVIGLDENENNELRFIDFKYIKGGKPFNVNQDWFLKLLHEIGQIN